jgi:hypothetical protein
MMEAGGLSHCFNCNRDGHFQVSCPNPPFCYNCKKDGHMAMSCPAKKGFNMRICGYGMPRQAFYIIHVPEEEKDKVQKTFPDLLTFKEGVANEVGIDAKLEHPFKGKSRWTIKKIDEDNFILHFPSANLIDKLPNFKGFEFAIAIIKAKVVPTEVKKVVSVLDETWVKATCFSKKAKKFEVIKEISHLVGGPVEVDDKLLKAEEIIRVKVFCKDAIKINCSTLLYINGQGRLLNVTVHPKIVLSCKPDTNNHKRVREREGERRRESLITVRA